MRNLMIGILLVCSSAVQAMDSETALTVLDGGWAAFSDTWSIDSTAQTLTRIQGGSTVTTLFNLVDQPANIIEMHLMDTDEKYLIHVLFDGAALEIFPEGSDASLGFYERSKY